jgi:hypothetical protein
VLCRPAPARLLATRRTTLGAAAGAALAVAVTGCDAGSAPPAAGTPTRSGTITASPTEAVEDPDAQLVEEVLAELASLVALTDAVATRFPGLATPMRALRDLHTAHREVLGGDPADDSPVDPAATAPGGRAAAVRRVRRAEQRAQRRLVDWAVAAQSGALARLLASMSAAVGQRLVTAPLALGTGTGPA